jgi:gamma-glutamyltranspeptidase
VRRLDRISPALQAGAGTLECLYERLVARVVGVRRPRATIAGAGMDDHGGGHDRDTLLRTNRGTVRARLTTGENRCVFERRFKGNAQMIRFHRDHGSLEGATDPRLDGVAIGL